MKTFADEADYLKRKWREACADPATGLELEAFRAAAETLVAERKGRESWEMVKAHLFELGCTRAAIDVSPYDWFPAFASWHYHRNHPMGAIFGRRTGEIDPPGLGAKIWKGAKTGRWAIWKDFDHCAPDWDAILPLGFPGLKKRLLDHWQDTEFYRSRAVAADALLAFVDRLIAQGAKNEAACAAGPRRARLAKEVAALKRLRAGAPQTAYDVLLFIYLFWVANENFDRFQTRTLGNLDRLLTPYYHADLAAGRTTEAEFREQLRHFWWQWGSINNYWGQPVYLGGTKADGTTEYNDVSKIILDIHDALCLPTPKMHLKMGPSTPDWVWKKTLDMARRTRSVAFFGEEPAARQMKAMGRTAEEARECVIWGCNEWGVRDSANTSTGAYVNAVKGFEDALADARAGTWAPADFAAFRDGCVARIVALFETARDLATANEANLHRVNPSNVFSLSCAWSVEKGVDAHGGGTDAAGRRIGGTRAGNNSVMLFIGLGTLVDALAAVKDIVYDRREMTLAALAELMAKNWAGREDLRRRMFRSPVKWGMNDPEANALAHLVVSRVAAAVNGTPNARGGIYLLSGHSARQHIELGRKTGATPDGRRAGEEMSKNISPTMGADRKGATAFVNSARAVDARLMPGDYQFDIALLPTTVAGDKGLQVMRALAETFFANGGVVMQFNVHDAALLRDAQAHPEKYETLMVRVCGWSIRWNDMPRVEQEKYILRVEEMAR